MATDDTGRTPRRKPPSPRCRNAPAACSCCSCSWRSARSSGRGLEERAQGLEHLALVYDDTIITESARTVNFSGQAALPRYQHVESQRRGKRLSQDIVSTKTVFGLDPDLTLALTIP